MKDTPSVKRIARFLTAIGIGLLMLSCHKEGPIHQPPPDPGAGKWTRVQGINDTIKVLEVYRDVIYAGSFGNRLYRSNDKGVNWSSTPVGNDGVSITAIHVFKNKLYVGSGFGRIYSSSDGRTWTVNPGSPAESSITSFTEHDQKLYASSSGDGVFVLDPASDSWTAFNANLPWVITSYDVFKLATVDGTLVAAAGINGTFYYHDFNKSEWVETRLPTWTTSIRDLITDGPTLLAVNSYRRILRSEDHGLHWSEDTDGLQSGLTGFTYPLLYIGPYKNYALVNTSQGLWIQCRNKGALAGSPWNADQEFISGIRANTLASFDGKLFLGTNNGVYIKN